MEKDTIKREGVLWVALVLPFIYTAYMWGQLPERIPIHFNLNGVADGWGGKSTLWLMPVINVFLYTLFYYLPKIDPKKMAEPFFKNMFYKIRLLLAVFMCGITFLIINSAKQGNFETGAKWMVPGSFLFFALLGNFMINIKPNWFVGIRTPWTLSSEAVWKKTHLHVGRFWFYGGLVLAVVSLLIPTQWQFGVLITFALGSAVVAMVYSFWLYKQEEKNKMAS